MRYILLVLLFTSIALGQTGGFTGDTVGHGKVSFQLGVTNGQPGLQIETGLTNRFDLIGFMQNNSNWSMATYGGGIVVNFIARPHWGIGDELLVQEGSDKSIANEVSLNYRFDKWLSPYIGWGFGTELNNAVVGVEVDLNPKVAVLFEEQAGKAPESSILLQLTF